jgi:hypothetical protein
MHTRFLIINTLIICVDRLLYQVGVQEEPTWPGKLAASTSVFLVVICSSLLLLLTFQWHELKTHPHGALYLIISSVRAQVASIRKSFKSGQSAVSLRYRIKPEYVSSQQFRQSTFEVLFSHYIEPYLIRGKYFVFRKALSLLLEVFSRLFLAMQYGRIGVSASIVLFQIFMAVISRLNDRLYSWLPKSWFPFST